jgi:hypothetical protein
MTRKVNVIGVGMVPFAKPGESEEYNVMASKAGRAALEDAKIPFGEVQQAYAGYVFGDSTCGQRAVYEIGLTGIPVFNVNNNCSTGSSALMLGAPGHRRRHRRVRARRRLRADGEGRAVGQVHRPHEPARQARQRDERGAGLQPGPAGRADVRRRRPRVPLEVRHEARDLREDLARRRASTRRRTPTRCSRTCSSSRRSWPRRGLRSADALPVLPAHVRRGGGRPVLATTSPRSTASASRSTSPAQAMTTDFASASRRSR